MKKISKKEIIIAFIAFIFVLILAGGVVYAAISAREITYTTSKNSNIKNVEEALNDLYNKQKNNLIYSAAISVNNVSGLSNGTIVLPEINNTSADNKNYFVSTYLNPGYTLSKNEFLTLPAGSYIFNSLVNARTSTYGVGFKILDTENNLIIDHTPSGTTNTYETSQFTLQENKNIVIKWYRTSNKWYDIAYYSIFKN